MEKALDDLFLVCKCQDLEDALVNFLHLVFDEFQHAKVRLDGMPIDAGKLEIHCPVCKNVRVVLSPAGEKFIERLKPWLNSQGG